MSDFMGPDKPSIPVTTSSNCTPPPALRWCVGQRMRQPRMTVGLGITGSQDFIQGAGTRFRLSRDFADGCRTWDPGGHAYDVLVRFFPYSVYIDWSHRDTLGYEWLLVHCCHLVVCLVVLMAWIRGCWIWLCLSWWLLYYFTYDIDFCQCSACLCML
jgi:hypothetical protein